MHSATTEHKRADSHLRTLRSRVRTPSRVQRMGHTIRTRVSTWAARLSATGVVCSVLSWCISLAPSLVPRSWVFQALLTGVLVILGYGFGASVGGFMRWLGFSTPWPESITRLLWRIFAPIATFSVVACAYYGARFQGKLRVYFGMQASAPYKFFFQALIAVTVALALLWLARRLRAVGHWLTVTLNRWFPYRAAVLSATLIVSVAFLMLLDGTLIRGSLSALNTIYASSDKEYPRDATKPTSTLRSGSDASASSWEDLGYMGRAFVGSGPDRHDIQQFASRTRILRDVEAKEPIRVYAGLADTNDLDKTASQVVEELNRTGAWKRKALLVATATGTGWIDPAVADTFEYLNAGNTAIASMQYSYLPSWVSFLSDRATPPKAGKALFEAIYSQWLELPENSRPKLYVFGLSLGSYGMQGAFSGLQDITERTDGAVFAGTPHFTNLWDYFVSRRDAGSRQIEPVFEDGKQVRFSSRPDDASNVWDLGEEWRDPKVVYLNHASDAVTWWSPKLIWNAPDWIREAPGEDRPSTMRWYPVVTFFQVSFDMFVSGDVPAGHGHMYVREYADAFAAVCDDGAWTEADLTALKDQVQFGADPH